MKFVVIPPGEFAMASNIFKEVGFDERHTPP
jgi:hypothetical protein